MVRTKKLKETPVGTLSIITPIGIIMEVVNRLRIEEAMELYLGPFGGPRFEGSRILLEKANGTH